ncbi:MAG: TIGR03435 family protein [Acidobacteriota bacterium]
MRGAAWSIMLALPGAVYPQVAAPPRAVTSVKPNGTCGYGSARASLTPGHLQLTCTSLRSLIATTYTKGLSTSRRVEVLGGPPWLDKERFDIAIATDAPVKIEDLAGSVMRALLEDRFALKAHRENRDKPVYLLTVLKPSANLQVAKPGNCSAFSYEGDGSIPKGTNLCGYGSVKSRKTGPTINEWYGTTLDQFIGHFLEGQVGRPVLDRTNLSGRYDLRFEFDLPRPANGGDDPPVAADIFTLLREQLGLALKAGRGPVEVVVIDSISRPSPN